MNASASRPMGSPIKRHLSRAHTTWLGWGDTTLFCPSYSHPAIAGTSRVSVSVSHCTSHPSGYGLAALMLLPTPSAFRSPEDPRYHAASNRLSQILWLMTTQPWLTAWAAKMVVTLCHRRGGLPIRPGGLLPTPKRVHRPGHLPTQTPSQARTPPGLS